MNYNDIFVGKGVDKKETKISRLDFSSIWRKRLIVFGTDQLWEINKNRFNLKIIEPLIKLETRINLQTFRLIVIIYDERISVS